MQVIIDDYQKEELKAGLRTYVESITQPDRRAGRNMYQCPLCGSGKHGGRDSDGAFSIFDHGKAWQCFSCKEKGDIFKLIELHEGITNFKDQLKRAVEISGISFYTEDIKSVKRNAIVNDSKNMGKYKNYIEQCKAAVYKTDYFKSRGFDDDVIRRFDLGYDEDKKVIVIPYDVAGNYYLTRKVEIKKFDKPKTEDAGKEPVYNKSALYDSKPCFITESPLDAISIMVAGNGTCGAVALGGTGQGKLMEQIKEKTPTAALILSLDHDEAGEKGTKKITEELKQLKIPFLVASYALEAYEGNKKDGNDLFRTNLEQFQTDIQENIAQVEFLINAEKLAKLEVHNKNSASFRLQDFVDGMKAGADTPYVSTGFEELDRELDGGLYSGLYILGAISSMGKTTFLLQIADQIAQSGKDVLYFSLEMAASELISKSISRHTHQLCDGKKRKAKTARGITTASRYKNYSLEEKMLIEDAITAYGAYANHLYLYEGIGDIGVERIKELVMEHKELTGNIPLIFIDYLQILAPYDLRASDKQNTDKSVLELKRLSRDFKTTVMCISSFNRDNYLSEVNMAAFKESGAVEYGSDILMALQPQGMQAGSIKDEQKKNAELIKKCKGSEERDIELVILKNRNGRTGGKVNFTYYSLFNCFEQNNDFHKTNNSPFDSNYSGVKL